MPQPITRSQRINAAFNGLSRENLHTLDRFFAPDAVFEDPVGRFEGLDAIRTYFGAAYKSVEALRFEFSDELVQGDTHAVFWTMYVRSSKVRHGKEIPVDGGSRIVFNAEDKVVYHRDYYDLGALLYEHLPVLGTLIRGIRQRLGREG